MTIYKQGSYLHNSEASYIAGLLDGEGTITLSRRHKKENRQLVISISSSERAIVEYLREATGVGVLTKKRTYHKNHATNFTYKVSNRQALDLLQQISPCLKSYKKQRALLILDKYLELTPRNGKYTMQLQLEREKFVNRFFNIAPLHEKPLSIQN